MHKKKPFFKRFNVTSVASYISVAVLMLSILSVGYNSTQQNTVFGVTGVVASEEKDGSIDQVAAAMLATSVAQSANISVEANVANLSTSLNARAELAQSNQDFASKPQMTTESMRNALRTYKVKTGDTLPSIAAAHGVSVQTIQWANNLTNETVAVDADLRIPTVDGIIYTVKDGDTPDSIAAKYGANKDRIISFNNAELSGLKPGQEIVVPGGILPEEERPGYRAPARSSGYGYGTANRVPFTPSYSIGYPFGWCTYYAAAKSGAPGNWGNANTWDNLARQTPGWTVSKVPVVGAIAQTDAGGGGYGHVAIVEAVSADGSQIMYSDMNGIAGFGGVGKSDWVPVSYFQNYIYR